MRPDAKRGAALLEFALMALTIYMLVAGGIELGRLVFVSHVLQDAARVAARELSVKPLPAEEKFEDALEAGASIPEKIFDPDLLVIDIKDLGDACPPANSVDQCLDEYFQTLPLINRMLRPVYISEVVKVDAGLPRMLLRYPGALLLNNAGAPLGYYTHGLTVRVPRVKTRGGANGEETEIEWIPVVAELRTNPSTLACGSFGPFPFTPGVPTPGVTCVESPQKGMAAVVINYPFQSAALTGFRKNPDGPLKPNLELANRVPANEDTSITHDTPTGTTIFDPETDTGAGTYTGPFGLGRQYALLHEVRPFRKLILGQAIFRREVIE